MRLSRISVAASVLAVTAASLVVASPANADRFRNDEWHIRSLKVVEANKISTGNGIIVAVVDTGVFPHADLRSNLLTGASFVAGGKGSGQDDSVGHGTKMASLIAAHGRPHQSGVVGIAPGAKILPVKYTNANGSEDIFASSKAIDWAVDHGAQVISFSGAVARSASMQSAIADADKKDVLVVAAAGNVGQDIVAAYPAAVPGVLAVGASDESGQHATVSLRGSYIQICAPGVEIEGALPPDRYTVGKGTSDSAAIVSGAAALVRAKFPELSAAEVIHRLTATATDIGKPGRDDECGYGVLDIVKALTADVPPLEGAAGPTASASAATIAPTSAAPSGAGAEPEVEAAGTNTPAIVGGVVFGLVVVGLLVFLGVRRRRSS